MAPVLEGDLHASRRSLSGKTRSGTRHAPGMFVARSRTGGRGPDEPGNRVSAAATHAGERGGRHERAASGLSLQSVRSGTCLARRLLPAASPRDGENRPGSAGGAVRRAGQRDASQSGTGGAHGSDPPGGKISQVRGRMGPVVSCCWRQPRRPIYFRRWRRPCQHRRSFRLLTDWHGRPLERGGSLC